MKQLSTHRLIKQARIGALMPAFATKIKSLMKGSTNVSFGQGIKNVMGPALTYGAALGIGGAIFTGLDALVDELQDYKLDKKKQPKFEEMLLIHPDLRTDKIKAKIYFDALWHFSPSMAKSPLAAGAYIKQALRMHHVAGGPLPESIGQLSQIEKNLAQAQHAGKGEGGMFHAILAPLKPQAGSAYPSAMDARILKQRRQQSFRRKPAAKKATPMLSTS